MSAEAAERYARAIKRVLEVTIVTWISRRIRRDEARGWGALVKRS